jgi:hypothetical protein
MFDADCLPNPTLVLCCDAASRGGSGNLPHGIHEASWNEFAARCGTTPHCRKLLSGIKRALDSLWGDGLRRAYIDGSFVTSKEHPSDFDACWEESNVDASLLDPSLLDFSDKRRTQKARFGGEVSQASMPAGPGHADFIDYFQHDPNTRQPKGIVAINLKDLP